MTVLDFRSGGCAGPHDGYGAQADDAQADHWQSRQAQGWTAADDDWDDANRGDRDAARLTDRDGVLAGMARLTHYVGAMVSVVLMAALAIWGYQLVVRDVSGVPVIRAVEGDARVVPEEPGGELTERTGLAVNNVAGGARTAPVDKVAIAPQPVALDGQDVAMGQMGATAQPAVTIDDAPVAAAPAVAVSDADAARLAQQQAALAAEPVAELPPVPDASGADAAGQDGTLSQDSAITAALAEAVGTPSVTTTTRPRARPQRIAAANLPAAAAASAAPAVAAPVDMAAAPETAAATADAAPDAAAVKPVAVPSGTPLVQIGAFDSTAIADSEWGRISSRHSDLFAGKAPVVQEHKAGGRTFYRLRVAGFGSRDDARKFCAALIAAGADCIPAAAK